MRRVETYAERVTCSGSFAANGIWIGTAPRGSVGLRMADRGREGHAGAARRTIGTPADIRLRSAFGDVEVQLRPAPVSAADRDASVRELRKLVYGFKYGEPEARRAVAAILADLRGASPSAVVHELGQLDIGSPRADAYGEEVLGAGGLGGGVARGVETRS